MKTILSSALRRAALSGAVAILIFSVRAVLLSAAASSAQVSKQDGLAAFETVRAVLQHPRCQNCHIPGDAPLQFDTGVRHAMGVMRGAEGHGAPGLPCATCHGESNPPASYGPNAPPGAPHWGLPPPEHKMAWIGLSPSELCATIKSKKANRGRDFAALLKH